MNEHSIADSAQEKFASAVKNYEPKMAAKLQKLVRFKEGISELRRKGASYDVIADILSNLGVKVSRFTVTRFCREVLKVSPPRSKSQSTIRRTLEQPACNDSQVERAAKADPSRTTRRAKE
jgi:hypothetical protein